MLAYEFYSRDELDSYHFIGILPERRKHQERITEESIMEWVKMILGDAVDMTNFLSLRNRITAIGGFSQRLVRLAKDTRLAHEARMLHEEVLELEAHLTRFEKYMNI